MVNHERLAQVLADFARNLVAEYQVEEILDQLCKHVPDILPVTGCGVMLEDDDGAQRFVAASDDVVRHIERLQIELHEGPCLAAALTGEQVLLPDLRTTDRFPRFSRAAREFGMGAVYSFPMRSGEERLGAVNLYGSEPGVWTDADSVVGQLLADVATGYLLNARAFARNSELTGQLRHALSSRIVIEQAKGRLSAVLDVDVDEAFDRMRDYARRHGRRLHAVAAGVMDGSIEL
jgi:GAF domain-containing protein